MFKVKEGLLIGGKAVTGSGPSAVLTAADVGTGAYAPAFSVVPGTSGNALLSDGTRWVSGPLKTIGGVSLVGSGDITAGGGSGGAVYTTSTTLTSSSPAAILASPTDYGMQLTLPVGSTCNKGAAIFSIRNSSNTYEIGVKDSSGKLIYVLEPTGSADISLTENASVGTWTFTGSLSKGMQIVASAARANAAFTETYSTAGTYVKLGNIFLCQSFSSGYYYQAYDPITNTWGTAVFLGTENVCTNLIPLSATAALIVFRTADSLGFKARVISISGTTVTINAETVYSNMFPSAEIPPVLCTYAQAHHNTTIGPGIIVMNANLVVIAVYYRHTNQVYYGYFIAISISGTTVTIGAPFYFLEGSGSWYVDAALIYFDKDSTSSSFLIGYRDGGSFNFKKFTISGTTITNVGNGSLSGISNVQPIITWLSDSLYMLTTLDGSDQSGFMAAITVSGNTVVCGTKSAAYYPVANSSSNFVYTTYSLYNASTILYCNPYFGYYGVLSVSGTTLTQGANYSLVYYSAGYQSMTQNSIYFMNAVASNNGRLYKYTYNGTSFIRDTSFLRAGNNGQYVDLGDLPTYNNYPKSLRVPIGTSDVNTARVRTADGRHLSIPLSYNFQVTNNTMVTPYNVTGTNKIVAFGKGADVTSAAISAYVLEVVQ